MTLYILSLYIFFFNDTATTEIYTLSLHDALPISTVGSHTMWLSMRIKKWCCAAESLRTRAITAKGSRSVFTRWSVIRTRTTPPLAVTGASTALILIGSNATKTRVARTTQQAAARTAARK